MLVGQATGVRHGAHGANQAGDGSHHQIEHTQSGVAVGNGVVERPASSSLKPPGGRMFGAGHPAPAKIPSPPMTLALRIRFARST